MDEKYQELLDDYLLRNDDLWKQWQEREIYQGTPVAIEVGFSQAPKEVVQKLAADLRDQEGVVRAEACMDGLLWWRKWWVEVTLDSLPESRQLLNKVTRQMIKVGAKYSCEFTGLRVETA